MAAAASTTELILDEIKTTDGVDVAMKLESLGGSKRRISGGILIEAPVRAVWDVLTDYNRLQEYIPNIADSRTIRQPNGRLYLEQVGVVSKRIGLTSRILLDVEEFPYSKLTFTRVESREFLEFMGTYTLTQREDGNTYLYYSLEALPLPVLPIFIVQSRIRSSVPPMLLSVRSKALAWVPSDL